MQMLIHLLSACWWHCPQASIEQLHSGAGCASLAGRLVRTSGPVERKKIISVLPDERRVRVCGQGFHILPQTGNKFLVLLDLRRETGQHIVLQAELLALVVSFHNFELGNFHIQLHPLFDTGISCAQGFDFRVGKRCFVNIIAGADGRFRGHDL